uniref:Uncharacterized protein n=1 Tax=Anguilla anguilla TaxID=7936 RepID=A0A0E9XA13_ANGAN
MVVNILQAEKLHAPVPSLRVSFLLWCNGKDSMYQTSYNFKMGVNIWATGN